ncbi:MAG: isoprenylcysteine carboxylmethyltransferase family protein [bacterium]
MLFLILANLPYWFRDPLAPHQLLSWFLLAICTILAAQSFYLFLKVGKPQGKEEDNPNFWFENTANLVQVGVYKYIRHPMYGSLLFLGYGAFLKHVSIVSAIATIIISMMLYLAATVEESEDIQRFGAAYTEYMKTTKKFIPFIF